MNTAPEIEETLLGVLLLNPKLQVRHRPELHDILFSDTRNAIICNAILGLLDSTGDPCDISMLHQHLREAKRLDDAGGTTYITTIGATNPGMAGLVPGYFRTLRKVARLRLERLAAESVIQRLDAPGADPDEMVEYMAGIIDHPALKEQPKENSAAEAVAIQVVAAYDRSWELAKQGRRFSGVDTGFPDLSEFVNGLGPEMTVIGARPSIGKSTLACQIALHVAKQGIEVGFFTVEMSTEQLGSRICCLMAGVDPERHRRGMLGADDRERFYEATTSYAGLPIHLYTDGTVDRIRSRMSQRKAGLWVVDHLHRIKGGRGEDYERLNSYAEGFANLAIEFQAPVLLLGQLNRECENRPGKRPQLADFRSCGGIEEHAANAWLIHRPGKYEDLREQAKKSGNLELLIHTAEIIVEKQRSGQVGVVHLSWDPLHACFANMTRERFYPSHDNE